VSQTVLPSTEDSIVESHEKPLMIFMRIRSGLIYCGLHPLC
jgi:hypothetical protein